MRNQTPLAPWIKTGFVDIDTKKLGWMVEALEIDPFDSDHWLYGTGLTIYGGHDLTNWDTVHNISIQALADGIEEFAVQDLASAPGGSELLAAIYDENGFTFKSTSDLGTAPQTNWLNPEWASSTGVDYAGNSVANVVRVGNVAGTQQVAISTDGGSTWNINYGADTATYGGSVAYSADADTILWSSTSNGVLRSQYQSTFTAVSSVPSGAVVVSDKKTNTYFYAGSSATFYVSKDTGSTFAAGGTLGSATAIRDIAVNPATAGDVWVSTDVGIFHSSDFGSTFTQTSTTLTNTYQVALGVGSGSTWNVYAFGTGSAGARLYGSADSGATWTDIQGSAQGFGAIDGAKLAGSGSTAGQVYVGTNGRGVFWAKGTISGSSSGTTTAGSSTSSRTSTVATSSTTIRTSTTSSSSTVRSSTSTTVVTSTVRTSSTSTIASTTVRTTTSTSTAASSTSTAVAQHYVSSR